MPPHSHCPGTILLVKIMLIFTFLCILFIYLFMHMCVCVLHSHLCIQNAEVTSSSIDLCLIALRQGIALNQTFTISAKMAV